MASCVREQKVFIFKFGESILQVRRYYRQHFKLSNALKFKFQLLSRTDWFLIYSTLKLLTNLWCTESGRIWRIKGLYSVPMSAFKGYITVVTLRNCVTWWDRRFDEGSSVLGRIEGAGGHKGTLWDYIKSICFLRIFLRNNILKENQEQFSIGNSLHLHNVCTCSSCFQNKPLHFCNARRHI
jgi:hypothetical protein